MKKELHHKVHFNLGKAFWDEIFSIMDAFELSPFSSLFFFMIRYDLLTSNVKQLWVLFTVSGEKPGFHIPYACLEMTAVLLPITILPIIFVVFLLWRVSFVLRNEVVEFSKRNWFSE